MSHPRATCVIPTYNMARYVADAVESALKQTVPFCQIIVVDDGSTDDTASVLADFGSAVLVLKQQNQGVSVARNCGADAAEGDYLVFLDADDILAPKKLELQLPLVSEPEGFGFCDGFTQYFWSSELEQQDIEADHRNDRSVLDEPHAGHISSWLMHTNLMKRVGPFEPGCAFSEDTDWLLRCRALPGFCQNRTFDVVSHRRLHKGNATAKNREAQVRGLLRSIHRKRQRSEAAQDPHSAV